MTVCDIEMHISLHFPNVRGRSAEIEIRMRDGRGNPAASDIRGGA